jgi:hypothetical protein
MTAVPGAASSASSITQETSADPMKTMRISAAA